MMGAIGIKARLCDSYFIFIRSKHGVYYNTERSTFIDMPRLQVCDPPKGPRWKDILEMWKESKL